MGNMANNLAEARLYLSKVKPWAVIAAICAMVLVGFYSLEGYRYWNAWSESTTMQSEIDRIQVKLSKISPEPETLAHNLEVKEQRLANLRRPFIHADVARLMGIVSKTSWDSGVDLSSISAGDPVFQDVDGLRYDTQVLTLTVQGDVHDIYRFLSALHQTVPVVAVPSISVANPGPASTSQIQLVFYLSPEQISDEEGAD